MRRKGAAIWHFSTLTVVALVHLIDAALASLFNNPTQILQIYPFINQKLRQRRVNTYLYLTASSTVILWTATCLIAFDNPMKTFLNKILSDMKNQTPTESQILESKSELFDLMYETLEAESKALVQIKDLIRNILAIVKDIHPLKETRANKKQKSEP